MNRQKLQKKLLLAALLLSPALATAAAPANGFTGEAAVGYLRTSGNTDTSTFNGKVAAGYRQEKWNHAAFASALTGSKNKIATDERYALGYKISYDFTEHDYVFGSLGYENDRFSGIVERTTEAVGYGRRILTGPIHTLDAEVGVGLTQIKPRGSNSTSNSAVGLFNARYQWLISDTSSFIQTLKVEKSKDSTFVNPVSTLKLVVAGNLFATLGYEVRYNSEVPVGVRKTDTLTSVNLGYTFAGKK